ncbi:MAG: LysR family transcriptional regulator, partial [Proteobacteria bacterium]|nr:LysR family transcriptional regulator [Pseudomonadota bacterium]
LSKDLNLLKIFLLLMEVRNISHAAKRLNLTQPAVSKSLSKLREEFSDPLFMRASTGIIPTEKAVLMEEQIRSYFDGISKVYVRDETFDPQLARGIVRIATTDYFEQVCWIDIVTMLMGKAPNLTFVTQQVGSQIPYSDMRDGTIQLAIAGYFSELPKGVMLQQLFVDEFKSAVRKNHPLIADEIDFKQFMACKHAMVSPRGDLSSSVKKSVKESGRDREVGASVSSFMSSVSLVSKSDLILTTPGRLIDKFAKHWGLKVFKPPLKLEKIRVSQVWHERYQFDPLHSWLRKEIYDFCRRMK